MSTNVEKPQEVIEEFFKRTTTPEFGERSVLQALINDLNFCVGGARYKPNMTLEEAEKFYKVMPTFACISIYCTSIDLLARVSRKRVPNRSSGETNGEFFKFSAKTWFNHTEEQAEHLWDLRNAISHHYKLTKKDSVHPYGAPLMGKDKNEYWHFNLIAMFGNLRKASEKLYEHLMSETDEEKQQTANYINENGMFFVLKS